jgi:hypothetical protein
MLLLHQGPFVSLGLAHAQSGAQTVSAYPAIAYANGVQASIVNQTTGAPTWVGIPAPTFTAGSTAAYDPTVFISNYNVITDTVTVSGSGIALPSWLTLIHNTLVPDGTQIDASDFSGLILNVSRSGGSAVSSPSITVTVNPALSPSLPTWSSAPVVNVTEGYSYPYTVQFYVDYYNGNTDIITEAPGSTTLPAGVSLYGNNFTFTGALTPQTISGVQLQISRNGGTAVPSGTFSIIVTAAGTPVWDFTPNPIFTAGNAWDYDAGQCVRNYSTAIDVISIAGGSASLPSGITLVDGKLHGDGTQTVGSVVGIILQVSRRSGTPVSSSSFGVTTNASGTIRWLGMPAFSSKPPIYQDNTIFLEGFDGYTTDQTATRPYDVSGAINGFNTTTDSVSIVSGPSWMYVDNTNPWLLRATGTQRSTDTTPKLVLRCTSSGVHQDTHPLPVEVRSLLDRPAAGRQVLTPTYATTQSTTGVLLRAVFLGASATGVSFSFNSNPYSWLTLQTLSGDVYLMPNGAQPGNGTYAGVVLSVTTPLGQTINFPCSIVIRDPDTLWLSMPSSYTLMAGSTQEFELGRYLVDLPYVDTYGYSSHLTLSPSSSAIPSWMRQDQTAFWLDGTEVNGNSVSGLKLQNTRWELKGRKMGLFTVADMPSMSVNIIANTRPAAPITYVTSFPTPTIDAGLGAGPRKLQYGKHTRIQDVGARDTDYVYLMGGDGIGQWWGGNGSGTMDVWATVNVLTGAYSTDYYFPGTVGHPTVIGLDGAYACYMPSRGKYFCAGYADDYGPSNWTGWIDFTYKFSNRFPWYNPTTHFFEDQGARPALIDVNGSTGEGFGIAYDSSRDKIITGGSNVMYLSDPTYPFTISTTINLDRANLRGGGTEAIASTPLFLSHMEYDPITDHCYWAQNGNGRLYRTHLGTHVTEKLCVDLCQQNILEYQTSSTQPIIWMLDSLYCLVIFGSQFCLNQDIEISWRLVNLQTGSVTAFNGYNAGGASSTGGFGTSFFDAGCYNLKNRKILLTGGGTYYPVLDNNGVIVNPANGSYYHIYDASGLPLR